MKKVEFSALANLTTRRLAQLIDEGHLTADKGEIDPLPSLVALLRLERERNASRDARGELMHAQIRAAEIKHRRILRQLLTIEEFRALWMIVISQGLELGTTEGGELYYEIVGTLGELAARAHACKVQRRILRVFQAAKSAITSLCEHIRGGMLADGDRLDRLMRQLMDAHPKDEAKAAKRAKKQALKPTAR